MFKRRNHDQLKAQLIGKSFGLLRVLSLNSLKSNNGKNNRLMAFCICDCGGENYFYISDLESGHTKSCGCIRKNTIQNYGFKDIAGQKFGKLFVDSYYGPTGSIWRCICECGTECIKNGCSLRSGKTKSCGCLNKASGKNHFNWKNSISNDDRLNKRGTVKNPLYEAWRKSIYKRDNYICRVSGLKGKVVAHHLFSWNSHSELRYDLNNGILLLESIHLDFHKKYGKGNNTRSQFVEFLLNLENPNLELVKIISDGQI